jgi:hypothetical protein
VTDLADMQLAAFDETRAQLPPNKGQLKRNGQTAAIIPSPTIQSRRLTETGYLPGDVSSIDIKRADFDRLGITDKVNVDLDGQKFRVLVIDDDKTDAILHVDLGPRR